MNADDWVSRTEEERLKSESITNSDVPPSFLLGGEQSPSSFVLYSFFALRTRGREKRKRGRELRYTFTHLATGGTFRMSRASERAFATLRVKCPGPVNLSWTGGAPDDEVGTVRTFGRASYALYRTTFPTTSIGGLLYFRNARFRVRGAGRALLGALRIFINSKIASFSSGVACGV